MQKSLVPPHGGSLKPLLLEGQALQEAKELAKTLPVVDMTSREVSDLIMLAIGAFSPLDGFMGQADYKNVVDNMELADGTFWPVPITLSISQEQADQLPAGSEVALRDAERDELMGIMVIDEKYHYDKEHEAKQVFGTTEEEHPGVKKVYDQHEVLIGGPVRAISEGPYPDEYGDYYARPAETRKIFEEKGWNRVAGFQTRNPMHRSHEYLAKIAMEVSDGVLIHPLVGKLKKGDIPADIRMQCYEVLFDNYYPKERVVLKVYPMEMRYGGPREALLHAVFRQNYGCSHLIIGRDHAGVGDYYGAFDAQDIFDTIPDEKLKIKPLKMDWTFWCHKCGEMASMKTCPHDKEDRVLLSGTKLREMLTNGERPPKEFSRTEVVDILMDYYQNKKED